jgi:transcriptional regulator with PAS, ATPase and Fis domain
MTYLWDVREYAQQLVEAVAAAVQLEITIVDSEGRRVAGSGRFLDQIGEMLPREFIFYRVLMTGESVVVTRPREMPVCMTCDAREHICIATPYICAPIVVGEQIVGGVGIAAHTASQAQLLERNSTTLMEFVDRLSDLLAARMERDEATEELRVANGQLATILQIADEAILAVDAEGVVTHLNPAGANVLGVSAELVQGERFGRQVNCETLQSVLTSGVDLVDVEATFLVGRRRVDTLASFRHVRGAHGTAGLVCFFRDLEHARKQALRLTGRRPLVAFDEIYGESASLRRALSVAKKVSHGTATVLLRGESGTGKELFAQAIHQESPRRNKPFIAINCAAIPETLLESELFGYEGGSFTGSKRDGAIGKLQRADGGTVFLDEIGDMPLPLQAKLLRVLQERVVERVGGRGPEPINIRVVAATNRDLERMVTDGQFRADLYYRLAVIEVHVPALRERVGDLPILMDRILDKYALRLNREFRGFTREARELLLAHSWPGNVRELENAIEYAVNVEVNLDISAESLPHRLRQQVEAVAPVAPFREAGADDSVRIARLLNEHGWDTDGKRAAAKELGISLATLYRRLKQLHLTAAFLNEAENLSQ